MRHTVLPERHSSSQSDTSSPTSGYQKLSSHFISRQTRLTRILHIVSSRDNLIRVIFKIFYITIHSWQFIINNLQFAIYNFRYKLEFIHETGESNKANALNAPAGKQVACNVKCGLKKKQSSSKRYTQWVNGVKFFCLDMKWILFWLKLLFITLSEGVKG